MINTSEAKSDRAGAGLDLLWLTERSRELGAGRMITVMTGLDFLLKVLIPGYGREAAITQYQAQVEMNAGRSPMTSGTGLVLEVIVGLNTSAARINRGICSLLSCRNAVALSPSATSYTICMRLHNIRDCTSESACVSAVSNWRVPSVQA